MSDTETLILCVQNFPCLWDSGIEDYHDREKRDLAWLELFKAVIPNWESLNDGDKKTKGQDIKRKWSNCRDYYKKDKQKIHNCPSGSAAKKGKRYVFADILNFLDRTIIKRNHEGNYDEVGDGEDLVSDKDADNSGLTEDLQEPENVIAKPAVSELKKSKVAESRKIKAQDVPGEILNLLKKPKPITNKEYDDDEKYLLSFSGDMKKMTRQQKIGFKLGMMQLLQKTFQENQANISSACYIPVPSSPSVSSPHIYDNNSRSSSSQSNYSIPPTIISISRPQDSPTTSAFYNTDPSQHQRVIINSIETITTPPNDYYGYESGNFPNTSQATEETNLRPDSKKQLLNFLSFK